MNAILENDGYERSRTIEDIGPAFKIVGIAAGTDENRRGGR
jgi:hypothetical protein